MEVSKTGIDGAYLINIDVYGDDRGFFLESYQKRRYIEHGIDIEFVQDNRSYSRKGVLRGLHYQILHPVGHLIYVVRGKIFDVGVDLRKESPTFGKHVAYTLSADKPQQLYLPPGVAHGYCALAAENEILYKCTEYYYPEDEAGVLWCDKSLGIEWPIRNPLVKGRDMHFPSILDVSEARLPFI